LGRRKCATKQKAFLNGSIAYWFKLIINSKQRGGRREEVREKGDGDAC